jgi:hypothetical protein
MIGSAVSRTRPGAGAARPDDDVGPQRAISPAARRTTGTGARRRTRRTVRSSAFPRDREAFSYREEFSLAQRKFLSPGKKASRSWR